MQRSSADIDTEPCHARSPTGRPPDACLKKVAMSKTLEELAREVARVPGHPAWQRGGQRNQRRKTGHYLCRSPHGWFLDDDTAAIKPLLGRSSNLERSTRSIWSKTSKFDSVLVILNDWSSASPWLTAFCWSGGSLAVIQPLWVQKTSEVPRQESAMGRSSWTGAGFSGSASSCPG